jgi:hypothetical protein
VTGETPLAKINVRYGTLMDYEPINLATDITLTGDGTHTIYIQVEVNLAGEIVEVTIATATTGLPDDDDYNGYITLGTAVVDTNAVTEINQACTHSLRMAMCGRVVEGAVLTTAGTFEFWGF